MHLETGPGLKTIVGIGDLAADIVVRIPQLPFNADDVHVTEPFRVEPGGMANFLIAAKRLGAPVAAVGGIGADMWGGEVRRLLDAESIDLTGTFETLATTTVLALSDDRGDHGLAGSFGGGRSGADQSAPLAAIAQAEVIFATGYSLQERDGAALVLQATEVSGPGDSWWLFDPGPVFASVPDEVRTKVLPRTDVLFATEAEIASLSAAGVRGILEEGPRYVVVKHGRNGCSMYGDRGLVAKLDGLAVESQDSTGAGDCFAAGFAVGLLRSGSLDDALVLANTVGAAAVQKIGTGRSVPTIDEVRQVIDDFVVPVEL